MNDWKCVRRDQPEMKEQICRRLSACVSGGACHRDVQTVLVESKAIKASVNAEGGGFYRAKGKTLLTSIKPLGGAGCDMPHSNGTNAVRFLVSDTAFDYLLHKAIRVFNGVGVGGNTRRGKTCAHFSVRSRDLGT